AGRIFRAEGAAGTLPDELIGKTVWEINPIVIHLLEQHGALAGQERLDHSYPHCWRCHNPVIFRATEQWFIGMERNELRTRALEAIKQVAWHPAWGEERMSNMIAMRPDWCISRQRVWGVPIIVFYCEQCATPFTDRRVLENVVAQFRANTADVWYSKTVEELMGPGHACAHCGNTTFRKESDILDVWFDSGSSHLARLTPENGLTWPSDMYIEGGDQYRGWFHSSLLIGVGLKSASPYRECATHGWTLDAEGRAMSKSLGNGIEPADIVAKQGADVLRLWVSSVDFTEDVRLSDTILTRLEEAYRKIRNSGFRYMLSNLHDFDPATNQVAGARLSGVDSWILIRAEDLIRRCRASYDAYEFHKVYRAIYDFVITDLSALYFDVSKDRLYTGSRAARRTTQTVLYRLNDALVRLLAPILSFTCEEVWQHVKANGAKAESVHIAYFPAPDELTDGITDAQRSTATDWDKLVPVRDQVLKALDSAREDKLIGSSLEAAVLLKASGDLYKLLQQYAVELPAWFIVSYVDLQPATDASDLTVEVQRARGDKCERCWKYTLDVGSNPEFPTVCAACASVLPEYLS
ncbi:MAG: class I tRNA ligase family protein, partial [Acidobacteriaceae bacterium]|nr:class I tRNA ligase family protein [Acidobacteriaceae bacterium]